MTEGDAIVTQMDDDHVWVEITSDCSGCAGSGGCGLSDGKGRRPQRVRNTVGAKIGDKVVLVVPDGAVFRAVFFCYLLPLTLALIATVAGMALAEEPGAIMGAIVGLIAGWLGLRRFGQREPAPEIRLKPSVVNFQRNPQT